MIEYGAQNRFSGCQGRVRNSRISYEVPRLNVNIARLVPAAQARSVMSQMQRLAARKARFPSSSSSCTEEGGHEAERLTISHNHRTHVTHDQTPVGWQRVLNGPLRSNVRVGAGYLAV